MNAKQAIARSISHTEIVTVEYSTLTAVELERASQDSVSCDGGNRLEFWGMDDDGNEWRVHLQRQPLRLDTKDRSIATYERLGRWEY